MKKIKIDLRDLKSTYESVVKEQRELITEEVIRRGSRASTYARDAVITQLSGPRTGRHYGTHQASAPGEAPAVKTGILRNSFETMPNVIKYGIGKTTVSSTVSADTTKHGASQFNYAWIDKGTKNIAPRPYLDKATEKALDILIKDLSRPY